MNRLYLLCCYALLAHITAWDNNKVDSDLVSYNNGLISGGLTGGNSDQAFLGRYYACDAPVNVNAGSINITTASVSFSSAGSGFIVEYGLAGFTPGADNNPGAGGTVITGTASPIAITGLTANTAYDVYVRQVCDGPLYSSNSSAVQFTTLCTATNIPYAENFDGVTAPALPVCISVQNVNGDNTWRTVGSDYYYSSPNIARLDYELDGITPANDWFYTRGLNLTGGTSYRLTFQYRNSDADVYTEKLEVKYGSAPQAADMITGTLFTNTTIDFNLWREGGMDFTPPSTGVYYIGFHGFSDADNAFLAIDDILVDVTPACPSPIGVVVNNITAASAVVNFSTSGSNYIIEYGLAGFVPGIGAAAGIGGTIVSVTSGQVPYTITGLNPFTAYDVYVRQVCGGPVYGPNSTKYSFITKLINDDAPGAITLTVGSGCTGEPYTNLGGTQTAGEPFASCSGTAGYATVWYKFVAPASGAVRISTAAGSGTHTLTDSRVALFSTTDVNDYSSFSVISCDDDNGAAPYSLMSVLYATGLTAGTTYYIQADVQSNPLEGGTFCLTVDELQTSMLATGTGCSPGQAPSGNNASYTGWTSLVDANSNLIALVRNPSGGSAGAFSVSQNINNGALRQDNTASMEYYLDRNYFIANSNGAISTDIRLFFLQSELAALQTSDATATLGNLQVTNQSGALCQNDFLPANGTNTEIFQSGNGSVNGVNWVTINTSSLFNFYIHSAKSLVKVKAYLQGAYSSDFLRHNNVTSTWSDILNANALNQPYNTPVFGSYSGMESVSPGFFTSNAGATTDIVDWLLVEIKNSSGTLIARRAGFVREDGELVDLDGISPLRFDGLVSGNYYLTIRHRNHLAVSTENLVPVNSKALGTIASSGYTFDFSAETDANIFGNSVAYRVIGANNVLICGNTNGNTTVRYAGPGNDPSSILLFLGSATGGVVSNVYSVYDVNMNGTVRYAGPGNDPGFLLSQALNGVIGTVISEQKR